MKSAAREVIGFDLGHGETAVARISLDGNTAAEILEIENRRSQITAIGRLPDKGKDKAIVFIGEKVLRIEGIIDARIGFKVRPPIPPDLAIALRDFLAECNRYLIAKRRIRGGADSHYFVGCPSGWSQAEVDEYQTVLRSSGIPLLDVVRESRAALLHAKETGRLTSAQLSSSVLVLDLGSSTLDATHIVGGTRDEKLDSGIALGGSLIEKEILRRALERNPRRQEIEAFFASPEGKTARTKAEVVCRERKETFWNNEEEYQQTPLTALISIRSGLSLEVALDDREMKDIVECALPTLQWKSWKATFLDVLRKLQGRFEGYGSPPRALVLTGGASRMSFVPDLCRQVFPDTDLIHCSPPEETVALGLARWGYIFLQTSAFSEEVAAFCRDELPALISSHSDSLSESLCEATAKGVASQVAGPALRSWRGGEIRTLTELESSLRTRIKDWLNSSAGVETTRASYQATLARIAEDVDRKTFPICDRHGVPPGALRLDLTEKASEGPSSAAVNPFETPLMIAGMISFAIMMVFNIIAKGFLYGSLASGGPPGWLVIGLISSLGATVGLGALTEAVKDFDIPLLIRETVLSDSKIEKITDELRAKITAEFKKDFTEKHLPQVIAAIVEQTTRQLDRKARQVKWIISDSEQTQSRAST
jgi:hypothetical protein